MNQWYVIQMKERYAKEHIMNEMWTILKERYDKKEKDIYISGCEKNQGLGCYIFLREDDMVALWSKLKDEKYLNEFFGYHEVSEGEVLALIKDVERKRNDIGFGDIVKLKGGKYDRLNGIVLREYGKHYEIGLRFCFGVEYESRTSNEVDICGNLFKYIKINRTKRHLK